MNAEATQTGDSPELEDLFDSIVLAPKKEAAPVLSSVEAPAATVTPLRPAAPAPAAEEAEGDSAELEDLFDSIANSAPVVEAAPAAAVEVAAEDASETVNKANRVINSVGVLTRQLHDTLVELGYDRHIQDVAAAALPDARQRIAYVVELTEQAATRSLAAVEIATPVQEGLAADAESLGAQWDAVFAGKSNVDEFKALAGATREYLKAVPAKAATTRQQLTEVMMAQEFQDLTGQVLKRVTDLANNLETQLLKLLVEYSPQSIKKQEALSILEGPQVNGGSAETVTSQAQVDDLLESLGF